MAERAIKAGLDATPLTQSAGGISRYAGELSRTLAHEFPDDEYWLLSDQEVAAPSWCPGNLRMGRRPSSVLSRRWWSFGLAREMSRLDLALFHGTDFAVPYLPLRPSVLTLHDLSPWKEASWIHAEPRVRLRTPFLMRLGLATMIITPSDAIRREAIEAFHLHPARVAAVPLAASAHFRPVQPDNTGPPYFLCVGVLGHRKNLTVVVEAWRELQRTFPVELVLAGPCQPGFAEPPPEPGLRYLGEVPDGELPRLYSGAAAVLYPSVYEGFGLPVLEAMSCGATVFVSRIPALAELAGDAGLLLSSENASDWMEAMKRALCDPEWRAKWRRAASRRSREFSWARTARQTREVYLEAMERFGR